MLVVFTKQDITEVREETEEIRAEFEQRGFKTFAISAVTREGLPELVTIIASELDRMRQADPLDSSSDEG
jgi:GTP-binding protein